MSGSVTTKGGRVLDGTQVGRLAARADDGPDLSTWKPRRGRPPLDLASGTTSPRIAVRLPEDLHQRVAARAAVEGRSISEVVRDLLERYVADRSATRL